MITNYSYSRAAILTFGGWGLQAMFHLLPRFQAAQEQRTALGAVGPDLQDTTSFGAILADPLINDDGCAELHLRIPRMDRERSPFYVERLIETIKAGPRPPSTLTAAERRARALLQAAEPELQTVDYGGAPFTRPAPGIITMGGPGTRRATRADIFRTAVEHADRLARLLETHILDPIRQDNLDPDDQFVQTTLYVVAPLFEPLTAAMIWPVVSQLMARTGRRHISQVVALLGTGSYAGDLSRSVEDAASYTALRELEVLTGLRNEADQRQRMEHLLGQAPELFAARPGEQLFDFIYLLDREKSNQGLADDSHELAVMTANALEALITANGNLYIQEQLGLGIHGAEVRPYSLVGAACDYVPVAQVLHAVNRQEESRMVRDWVLRSTPTADDAPMPADGSTPRQVALADLGLTNSNALSQLAQRIPELLEDADPEGIDDLSVKLDFLLPRGQSDDLRQLPAASWPAAFDARQTEAVSYLELALDAEAIDEIWGLAVTGSDDDPASAVDDRLAPAVMRQMHSRIVDLIVAAPSGLGAAQQQVQSWLTEVEQSRHRLQTGLTPRMREIAAIQRKQALRDWQTRYVQTAGSVPSLSGALVRAFWAVALVAALAAGYLFLTGQNWNPWVDSATLAGFAGGALLAGLAVHWWSLRRMATLRSERLLLAQTAMTTILQETVHQRLLSLYSTLSRQLQAWAAMLDDATDELTTLSSAPEMPSVPPPDVPETYLFAPHLNQELWTRSTTYLREQQDAEGQRSEERLDTLWGQDQWRVEMQRILRGAPDHGVPARGRSRARTIAEYIRRTVRESVAPVSLAAGSPARTELIRTLAADFTVEHMLWRSAAEAQDRQQRLRALELGNNYTPAFADLQAFPKRRYIESAWNRAKPTANYDVSDRLAIYGVTIDFVAASGAPESDLTRTLLNEFNITLLPTQNPFNIVFVRTVHGLGLDDLDCMQRYRAELRVLSANERSIATLVDDADDRFYVSQAPDHAFRYANDGDAGDTQARAQDRNPQNAD